MSGYDDPYAWERTEAYLAGIHEFSQRRPCQCAAHKIGPDGRPAALTNPAPRPPTPNPSGPVPRWGALPAGEDTP